MQKISREENNEGKKSKCDYLHSYLSSFLNYLNSLTTLPDAARKLFIGQ